MDLSILIVNWNTRELLVNCLNSIFRLLSGVTFEVIVVDNNSSDSSSEYVNKMFPQVELISNQINNGFVKANNQAYQKANGRYILLLNSDTLILDGSIHEIIRFLDDNEDVGAATGKVLNKDKSFQRPFRRFPHPLGAYFRHTTRLIYGFNTWFHKRYLMADIGPDHTVEVDWASGAYLFIRKSLIKTEYILDPDIFMYCEDTLLCKTLNSSGYRIRYLPLAPIIHYGGESSQQVKAFSAYHSFLSSSVYFRKIYGNRTSAIFVFSVILTWHTLKMVLKIGSFFKIKKCRKKEEFFLQLIELHNQGKPK
ncbi:glycosyltransferase [Desulfobacter latus]|uniref:Glycosyltransferase n=1 Tax=Desulfobacter latus TaxID=2292 RepID=A0A850SQH1_9BACT|nr:glycosyltransferase [Desulfobacter latus]NWH03704.1 glycosyltransferase [Desulfobacter latus]